MAMRRYAALLRGVMPTNAKMVDLRRAFEGARILCLRGSEVFTAYVPGAPGPVFMALIEKTLGEALTTRTWDTVKKVMGRGAGSGR